MEMRALVIGSKPTRMAMQAKKVDIDGVPVTCMVMKFPYTGPQANELKPQQVMIKVRAFSMNYRDKAITYDCGNWHEYRWVPVGSEFCGDVLGVGRDVRGLKVGDRVFGNNHFADNDNDGWTDGVPSNECSREIQIYHQAKLMKVPDRMSYVEGAAFSLGAQTAYSMVRKLDLKRGENVLVTAGRSNTSLFSILALANSGANVYVTTTSHDFDGRFLEMGVKEILHFHPTLENVQELSAFAKKIGGWHGAIDPFCDLHVLPIVGLLRPFGRYVTCGLYDQYLRMLNREFKYPRYPAVAVVMELMSANRVLHGNCLGLTPDLEAAVRDYEQGKFPVIVDSVFSEDDPTGFLSRTYDSKERFGKVVMEYRQ